VTLILWYGVQTSFKKQPPSADPDGHYSAAILDDLIACAHDDKDTHPVLGLFVQKDNRVAIDLYQRKKFDVRLTPYIDKQTEVEYLRMARILNPALLISIVEEAKKRK
jgi:hypothetical protein